MDSPSTYLQRHETHLGKWIFSIPAPHPTPLIELNDHWLHLIVIISYNHLICILFSSASVPKLLQLERGTLDRVLTITHKQD